MFGCVCYFWAITSVPAVWFELHGKAMNGGGLNQRPTRPKDALTTDQPSPYTENIYYDGKYGKYGIHTDSKDMTRECSFGICDF